MITIETHHFTIGRSEGCDLMIKHPSVSRAHLKVYYTGDSILVEDLNSEDGTYVFYNGEFKRVRSAKIRPETKVRLGNSLEAMPISELINDFKRLKEKEKNDISKRVKSVGLKRCFDCGTVMSKNKIHCECCGAILEETA